MSEHIGMREAITSTLCLLIDNDATYLAACQASALRAKELAPERPSVKYGHISFNEGWLFGLADIIKGSIEDLIDDIEVKPEPFAVRGINDFRQALIQSMCRHAWEFVDWGVVAEHIIKHMEDTE